MCHGTTNMITETCAREPRIWSLKHVLGTTNMITETCAMERRIWSLKHVPGNHEYDYWKMSRVQYEATNKVIETWCLCQGTTNMITATFVMEPRLWSLKRVPWNHEYDHWNMCQEPRIWSLKLCQEPRIWSLKHVPRNHEYDRWNMEHKVYLVKYLKMRHNFDWKFNIKDVIWRREL